MRKAGILACCVMIFFATFFIDLATAETPAGAKGFSHRYRNSSFLSWLVINMGSDSPNFNCHVAFVRDGSFPGGWGGAQADTSGLGDWIELQYCMYVDGYPRVRVNARSSLTLVDPVDLAANRKEGETCDCGAEIEPATQVRTEGPEDPNFDWPPTNIGWGWGYVFPDTVPGPPLPRWSYVIDSEETTGIIRITNHPTAEGIIFAKAFEPPDDLLIMVAPGQSLRFMPDGSVGSPGNILVDDPLDMAVIAGAIYAIDFEVWNLGPLPATFSFEADNTHGWPIWVEEPAATIPPLTSRSIRVMTDVAPALWSTNMVVLRATDTEDPTQTHWGSCYVDVDPSSGSEDLPPARASLYQVRPNPFNPRTTIWFDLPRPQAVTLAVHDLRGRQVRRLVSGSFDAGRHPVVWDGLDDRGQEAASGIYLARLVTADGTQQTLKLTLSK